MDALSDVLRVTRLSGGVFLEADLTAPWFQRGTIHRRCRPFVVALRHVIASHFVAAGSMQLRVDGGETTDVRAGEFLLLPHNDGPTCGSNVNAEPIAAGEIIRAPQCNGLARIKYGGGGAVTQLLCGYLGSDAPFSPLLSGLPSLLKVDVRATASGAWIESSFRFAASKIAAGRLGSTTVRVRDTTQYLA